MFTYIEEHKLRETLLEKSAQLTRSLIYFLETESGFEDLLKAVEEHSSFMSEFPQYPKLLTEKIRRLKNYGKTWTFKTTGAGGEDSLLFIGKDEDLKEAKEFMQEQGWYALPTSCSSKGMMLEEIIL